MCCVGSQESSPSPPFSHTACQKFHLSQGPWPIRAHQDTASLLLTIPQCGSTALKNPCCQNCFAASLCSLEQLQLHQAHANIVASSINFAWKTCWWLGILPFPGAACWLLWNFQISNFVMLIVKRFCRLTRNIGQSSLPSHLCFRLVLFFQFAKPFAPSFAV